jgi:thiamine-phosphate pyrophosphorylase
MLQTLFTEGARRALVAAEALAAAEGAAETHLRHLLWALALGESHAWEILQKAGISRRFLQERAPLALSNDELDAIGAGKTPSGSPQIPEAEEFRRIVGQCVQAASSKGRDVPVGTEDLLAGLASIDSSVSEILAQRGLNAETITGTIAQVSSDAIGPIATSINIHWRDRTETDKTETLRIIDAAANRAREGLRVLEDFVRFGLDDAHLTARLKECRHTLRESLSYLDVADLLRSRETRGDVGTRITTASESIRQSPVDIVQAACKRVQEAVRSLEEFGKLWSASAAASFERLRYELYTLEKAILLTELNCRALADKQLYLLVTESLCHHGAGPAILGALQGGVDIVQLREKEMPDRRRVDFGLRVREWTRSAAALLIMNDRPDLAVLTDADGVHVGQDEFSVKEARLIVGPHRLVGVSTHTIAQARQAVLDGADYIGVGPVFDSKTKSFDTLAGLALVREVAAEIRLPWFAIGGIDGENLESVLEAGARRIAVSRAISSAADPRSAAKTLADRLCRSSDSR